jgi:hypothetical protein
MQDLAIRFQICMRDAIVRCVPYREANFHCPHFLPMVQLLGWKLNFDFKRTVMIFWIIHHNTLRSKNYNLSFNYITTAEFCVGYKNINLP